jgi:hypothetical protein
MDVQFMAKLNHFFKSTLGLRDPQQIEWTDSAKAVFSLAIWGALLAFAISFLASNSTSPLGSMDGADLSGMTPFHQFSRPLV